MGDIVKLSPVRRAHVWKSTLAQPLAGVGAMAVDVGQLTKSMQWLTSFKERQAGSTR